MVGCKVDGPKAIRPVYIDSIHTFVLHSIHSYILMYIPPTVVPMDGPVQPPRIVHFDPRPFTLDWTQFTTWALWQCLALNVIASHVWQETRTDIGYASPLNSDDDLPKPLIKPIFYFLPIFNARKVFYVPGKCHFGTFFIFLNPPSTCSYHSYTDSYLESKC